MGGDPEPVMTISPADTCPVCNPDSDSAAERVAARKLAAHMTEKATRDEDHAAWVETNTDEGSETEVYHALLD